MSDETNVQNPSLDEGPEVTGNGIENPPADEATDLGSVAGDDIENPPADEEPGEASAVGEEEAIENPPLEDDADTVRAAATPENPPL
jgi:hypothetical protein